MNDTDQSTEDLAILEHLNKDYVHSDQFNDVKRFSEFLAEDFIVQLPGVTRVRAEFLEYSAKPCPFKDLALHDVNIRILSDVALIHGRSTYTMLADGGGARSSVYGHVSAPGSVSQPVRSLRVPSSTATDAPMPRDFAEGRRYTW